MFYSFYYLIALLRMMVLSGGGQHLLLLLIILLLNNVQNLLGSSGVCKMIHDSAPFPAALEHETSPATFTLTQIRIFWFSAEMLSVRSSNIVPATTVDMGKSAVAIVYIFSPT